MKKDTTQNSVKPKIKFIVTPGLIPDFFEFLNHCKFMLLKRQIISWDLLQN